MAILSFSTEHEAGASIISDGKILAAVNEERFTRVKNQDGFPAYSIKAVFEIANITRDEINHVIIPEISKAEDFFKNVIPLYPTNVFSKNGTPFPGLKEALKQLMMSSYIVSKSYMKVGVNHYRDNQKLKKMFPKAQFHRVEHHVAHAASAFFTSNFDKALIISSDYWGDFASVD